MSFGEIMILYTQMVADETAARLLGDGVVQDKKRFKINMPDGTTMWLSGSDISEAFLRGWQSLEGKLSNPDADTASTYQKTQNTTLKTYAEMWRETYQKPKVGKQWLKTSGELLKNHIYPAFGELELQTITTEMVQKFLKDKENYSLSLVKKLRILLNQILASAEEDKLIDHNPVRSKRITVNGVVNEREALTEEELQKFKEHMNEFSKEMQLFIFIALYTGMRRGEILGLDWKNVDIEKKFIYVTDALSFVDNDGELKGPKSAAGNRKIPICDKLLYKLEETPSEERAGFVVKNSKGSHLSQSEFRRRWQNVQKITGCYEATPHRFRHYFATTMKNKIDVKTLQSILGHAEVSTTLDIYAHETDSDLINAGAEISSIDL